MVITDPVGLISTLSVFGRDWSGLPTLTCPTGSPVPSSLAVPPQASASYKALLDQLRAVGGLLSPPHSHCPPARRGEISRKEDEASWQAGREVGHLPLLSS